MCFGVLTLISHIHQSLAEPCYLLQIILFHPVSHTFPPLRFMTLQLWHLVFPTDLPGTIHSLRTLALPLQFPSPSLALSTARTTSNNLDFSADMWTSNFLHVLDSNSFHSYALYLWNPLSNSYTKSNFQFCPATEKQVIKTTNMLWKPNQPKATRSKPTA